MTTKNMNTDLINLLQTADQLLDHPGYWQTVADLIKNPQICADRPIVDATAPATIRLENADSALEAGRRPEPADSGVPRNLP